MMFEMDNSGLLIVLSGPSGVGKGTVCEALRSQMPDLTYSVSATTRKPRTGEQDGVNYFFKTRAQFKQMIEQRQLLEWAEYVGNYYGTPIDFVKEKLNEGKDVILEIEVQGALKVKKAFPTGIFIFLIPPSIDELKQRIKSRGTETKESIRNRLLVAEDEFAMIKHYDYAVINDSIDAACERIRSIVTAERCRSTRVILKNLVAKE